MPSSIQISEKTPSWTQSGTLDEFEKIISCPAIGLELPSIDLVEIMDRPNSDEILRDIAIMICERGVVMFRNQKNLTTEKHRELIDRLGALGGRPKENGVMTHALHAVYGDHPEVASLTPERLMMRFGFGGDTSLKRQNHAIDWHRDMAFERCPAAYSSLRVEQLPLAGGDTMYCSSYELYDRMSATMQAFMEKLTCTWKDADSGRAIGREGLYTGPRGSPLNVGFGEEVVHPAVRTHPVTGFKSLYAWGTHCSHFNDVTPEENEVLMNMIEKLVTRNHDIQTRVTWRNPGDMAIWDNRAVMHTATMDQVGKRLGFRCLTAGEQPYLDPKSTGRTDARKTLKAQYDAEMAKIKAAKLDVEAQYENGKQVNSLGHFGVNVVSPQQLLAGVGQ